MQSAVIIFPGSNCDRDMAVALETISGNKPHLIWHNDSELPSGLDLIALPGGFSYGDYLRAGAIASRSNIMNAVKKEAERGVKVLGVCNGFQVLTEVGMLPGALMRNKNMNYICRDAHLTVEQNNLPFTSGYSKGQDITIPVAHHDGNYFADDAILDELEDTGCVVFRYRKNLNGSARDIAGITNAKGNVIGMMPHPERAIDPIHGGTDGRTFFESLVA